MGSPICNGTIGEPLGLPPSRFPDLNIKSSSDEKARRVLTCAPGFFRVSGRGGIRCLP